MFFQRRTKWMTSVPKFLHYLQWKTIKMHIPSTPKLQRRRTQSKAKKNYGVEFDVEDNVSRDKPSRFPS